MTNKIDIDFIDEKQFKEELYVNIPESKNKTYTAFKLNSDKNAFNNVLVPDHSRVVLEKIPRLKSSIKGSDYINANWLCNKRYIATQYPLANTVNDFYRMCWENKIGIIININNKNEYVPALGHSNFYGSMIVRNNNETIIGNIIIRELLVKRISEKLEYFILNDIQKKSGDKLNKHLKYMDNLSETPRECLTIYHIHYIVWPDFGIPDVSDFIKLMDIIKLYDTRAHFIRNSDNLADKYPIVVHCRAGLGRTGVLITIHHNMVSSNKKIDVINTIQKLREDRNGMVQTADQAYFCQMILQNYVLNQKQRLSTFQTESDIHTHKQQKNNTQSKLSSSTSHLRAWPSFIGRENSRSILTMSH